MSVSGRSEFNWWKAVAGKTPTEEIAAAAALRDAGSISAEEFELLKAKALA